MSINEAPQKIKYISLILTIILVSASSFGLGRLSKIEGNREAIKVVYPANMTASAINESVKPASEKSFVASKKGKKYYPSDCSAAGNIKESNKIYFKAAGDAESAGYTLSASCN